MRRSLRVFLVALLAGSLLTDAASAGWHHRRVAHASPLCGGWWAPATAVVPVMMVPPPVWDCGSGEIVVWEGVVGGGESWEEIGVVSGCEACCEGGAESVVEQLATEGNSLNGMIVEETSRPPAEEAVIEPVELVPAVMEEPLQVVTGDDGADGSSVLVAEPIAGEQPLTDEPTTGGPSAAPEPESPSPEPVVHDPLTMESPNREPEPAMESEEEPVESDPAMDSDETPAEPEPAEPPEPVNIFEAEEGAEASVEPLRRWIHARGDRSLVARLVGLPNTATCLLEAGGRRLEVPLDQLSPHDRAYVSRTVERLAATRAAAKPSETAGL